jgi:hypothetical protein
MTVRVSALFCGLALLLAVAIGAGTVGYWLAGDSAEAQGTWQVYTASNQGDPHRELEKFLTGLPVNCMVAFDYHYWDLDLGVFDLYIAYACP